VCEVLVLSSVLKCQEAVMCAPQTKYTWLDKLYSGTSYSAVGCEFSVNESIIYIK